MVKYLVYNARKRSGDNAAQYFQRTEDIAGVKGASHEKASVAHATILAEYLCWASVAAALLTDASPATDLRFQALMPDVLHWLGVKKIDNVSDNGCGGLYDMIRAHADIF